MRKLLWTITLLVLGLSVGCGSKSEKIIVKYENWESLPSQIALHQAVVDAFNAGLGKGLGPTLVSGAPRARAITLEQFEAFAQKIGAVIERAEYFCLGKPLGESEELAELLKKSESGLSAKAAPAWLADTALYVLLKK